MSSSRVQLPIGVGVIGIGVRGQHSYEQVLRRHPDVRIVAVSSYPDVSPVLLEGKDEAYFRRYADNLGAVYCEDYRDILTREDVQLISLMVEPSRAPEFVEEVAAVGKHIVRDKPMCTDVEGAERIVHAVEQAGVQMLLTLSTRYYRSLRAARQRVRSGEIGRLLVANFSFLQKGGPLAGFRGSRDYRDRFGGGEVTNFGFYAVDLLLWLVGSPVESVYAEMGTFFYDDYREAGMEDLGQVMLRFADGTVGALLTGRTTTPTGDYGWLDLTGTEGSLTVDHLMGDTLSVYGEQAHRQDILPSPVHEMVFDFVGTLKEGWPSPIGPKDGREVLRVLSAAYASVERGQPCRL